MALRDVTNSMGSYYVPQIKLLPKFAPLIRRGQRLEDQATLETFAQRRAASETNIDLWTDGRLYPVDPATSRPPSFRTTKQYMEYLCEGENGMLGYTKCLKSSNVDINGSIGQHSGEQMADCVSRLQSEVFRQEHCILQLRAKCDELHVQVSSMALVEAQHREERLQLQADKYIPSCHVANGGSISTIKLHTNMPNADMAWLEVTVAPCPAWVNTVPAHRSPS